MGGFFWLCSCKAGQVCLFCKILTGIVVFLISSAGIVVIRRKNKV